MVNFKKTYAVLKLAVIKLGENNLKKAIKLSLVIILMFAFATSFAQAQDVDGLYYSPLMVKDSAFHWNVTVSENFYEEISAGVNFTVILKDDLYPGPISEADLEKVYASVKVDGDKYTGEGFPLFWHLYKLEADGATNTTIREEFEAETTLFTVNDGVGDNFIVNFTIVDDPYTLDVELDINPATGLTETYYEHFTDNSTGEMTNSTIELSYLGHTVESPLQALWALAGVFSIGALVVIRKRRNKK